MILLDTHALLWLDQDTPALGSLARKKVDAALRDNLLAVSAITFWETAMLANKGRIELLLPVTEWRKDLLKMGLVEVVVDGNIGVLAAGLTEFHGDPADRLILATAMANGAALLTADQRILKWKGDVTAIDARR